MQVNGAFHSIEKSRLIRQEYTNEVSHRTTGLPVTCQTVWDRQFRLGYNQMSPFDVHLGFHLGILGHLASCGKRESPYPWSEIKWSRL